MDQLNRLSAEQYRSHTKLRLTVVLDNIRSMHNVGSIFRTADAFGVERLCLCGITPQPPHREIHKTALGATETVAWQHFPSTEEAVAALREDGYYIYGVEQTDESVSLNQVALPKGPVALVLGNEVDGVGEEVLDLCHGAIEIGQMGTKHSLNVAVAAGIVVHRFYEMMAG